MNRKSNSAGYWRASLTSMIDDINDTITTDIEDPAGRLGLGASRLAAKIFMLHYKARNDPDLMVWESFVKTVEEATQKIAAKPWHAKLVYFLRGARKRTGLELETFIEVQAVLAYLLRHHRPVGEPTFCTVLDTIESFPGADIDSPTGFNAMRLAWDKSETDRIKAEEEEEKKKQDKDDAEFAVALGFADVDAYRASKLLSAQEAHLARNRDLMNREIAENIQALLTDDKNRTVVDEPQKDGGYYFWTHPHWYRLSDEVRDRMIMRGGRAAVR